MIRRPNPERVKLRTAGCNLLRKIGRVLQVLSPPRQIQLSLIRTLVSDRGKDKQKYTISAKPIHDDLKNMIFLKPQPKGQRDQAQH